MYYARDRHSGSENRVRECSFLIGSVLNFLGENIWTVISSLRMLVERLKILRGIIFLQLVGRHYQSGRVIGIILKTVSIKSSNFRSSYSKDTRPLEDKTISNRPRAYFS